MIETIKSYLVSLGFSVDKSSYRDATRAMDDAEKSVTKFAGSAVTKFAAAGAAVTAFVATASIGISKFINDVAQADLQTEMLARQLWLSKDAAMAYDKSLKAMGVTLQDLYLSPELMSGFKQLQQESKNLRPPEEFAAQMKQVRDVQFEFARMKLEASYALQWVGYYLTKYLEVPLKQAKVSLSGINSVIVKEMPSWTKVIAQVMSWFARMGITMFRAFKDLIRIFNDIGSAIPRNIKLIGAALTALGLILRTGPFGVISAILLALILLLDDFYTYLDGGESAFGPFWEKLIGFFEKFGSIEDVIEKVKTKLKELFTAIDDNGALDNLEKAFTNTFGIIEKIFIGGKTWIQDLFAEMEKDGVLEDLASSFGDLAWSVTNLLSVVTDLINKLLGLDETEDTLGGIGDVLNNVIIVALKTISGLVEGIAGYIDLISAVLGGKTMEKLKEDGAEAQERLSDQPSEGVLKDLWNTTKELFSDPFTGGTNFSDKVRRALGFLGGNVSGNQTPAFVTPPSTTQNNNSSKVTLTQTNNIYGPDPRATADAAHNNIEAMYQRSMQGVTW